MIGMFCKDIPPHELKDILQTNAQNITEGEYYRPLSEEELDLRKAKHVETCIQVNELESKKKLAIEHFKGKIKPLIEMNSIVLSEIKTRQIKKDGVLYEVANYDDEVIETYNEQGEFISHRKMRPEEKRGGNNVFALPVAK